MRIELFLVRSFCIKEITKTFQMRCQTLTHSICPQHSLVRSHKTLQNSPLLSFPCMHSICCNCVLHYTYRLSLVYSSPANIGSMRENISYGIS